MNMGATYWGILCRTCAEPIAFDTHPDNKSGLGYANTKPGAIRCSLGHNHIYFPRDFRFFPSNTLITDAIMQENRAVYGAINPSFLVSPDVTLAASVVELVPKETQPKSLAPDARREIAQTAAKVRWADWASKKAL